MRFHGEDTPRSAIVVERIMQQCPGGIQLHYLVSNGTKRSQWLEVECEPYKMTENEKEDKVESECRIKERKVWRIKSKEKNT